MEVQVARPIPAPARIRTHPHGGAGYYLFLAGVMGVSVFFLTFIHVGGYHVFPPAFPVFRRLFYFQYALLAGALLATIVFSLRGGGLIAVMRWIALITFYFLFIWVALWALVHRTFAIELTPALIIDGVLTSAPISEMGISRSELVTTLVGSAAVMILATALTTGIARRAPFHAVKKAFFILAGSFLILNLIVRIYFVWLMAHDNYAALAYDDCVPFPLRTERLWPGAGSQRIAMPNYASTAQTKNYLAAVQRSVNVAVPDRRNILFLNIESLRSDAVSPEAMPRLSSFRRYFQIQSEANHWSASNATPRSIFGMLTGVSGYYVSAFRYAGVTDPFLGLLLHSGYRVRFGKKAHLESADLAGLIPVGAMIDEINIKIDCGDPLMVDHYLDDRGKRPPKPWFDFLAFDATHWPYTFEAEDALFLPAPERTSIGTELLSKQDLEGTRNRYRNACHCVDRQVGRVLDDLERRNGFRDTIVVVVGDHGEEFQERGQLTHSGTSNDFQGRTLLWMHIPDENTTARLTNQPTTHLDIVPTILEALGFQEDVLYTQGRSLLESIPTRPLLGLAEHGGRSVPPYRCLVSPTYISNWRYSPKSYLFCTVQRRDGEPVQGSEWFEEVRRDYENAARMYDVLPDVSKPPRAFALPNQSTSSN